MKKIWFALANVLLTATSAFADQYLDSLYREYNSAKSDTLKYNTLYQIVAECLNSGHENYNPESVAGILDQTIKELCGKNDLRRFASFLKLKAIASLRTNKYDQAVQYCDSCIQIAEEYADLNELAHLYAILQSAYSGLNLRDRQVHSIFKSIDYSHKSGNLALRYSMLFTLGNIYRVARQYDPAIRNYLKSAQISGQLKDSINQAMCYLFCAYCYIETRDLKLAEEYLIKGEPVIHSKVLYQPFYYYSMYGKWLKAMNRKAEALKVFETAVPLAVKGHQNYQKANTLCEMAEIFIDLGQYGRAEKNLDTAKEIAYAEGNLTIKIKVHEIFFRYYEATGKPLKAFEELKIWQTLKESYNEDELAAALASSAIEADYSIKEAEQAEAQRKKIEADAKKIRIQKKIIYSTGAGLLLLGFHVFLLFRSFRKQKKAHAVLKATQSQLIQSEKMASLGELTAGIAHEIQNPLNFINNFSEVSDQQLAELNDELTKGNYEDAIIVADNLRRNLQKICQHGKRADDIVKRMLQHSRTCTGRKEMTNINALTDEFVRMTYFGFKAQDEKFKVHIETSFDESLSAGKGKINVVPQGIGMVIKNLLSNAFYAINEKQKLNIPGYEPKVSVITRKNGKGTEIIIKDNGVGISGKVQEKIFQPFFSTKPTGQGTGLGLSLSYDMVTKIHGGKLHVETREGEYAAFIVRLPN